MKRQYLTIVQSTTHHPNRVLFYALLFILTVLGSAKSAAGAQLVNSCTLISKPGSYVLGKNIVATANDVPACIWIVSNFVTVDLAGYTIFGALPNGGEGILGQTFDPLNPAVYGITLRGGTITNFANGIRLFGSGHKVEDIRATRNQENGIVIVSFSGPTQSSILRNNFVTENGGIGIVVTGHGASIIGNVANNNDGGINVECPSLIVQNLAADNLAFQFLTAPETCTQVENNPLP